jgi:RNA polymerase-binding transcription factor DksA
MTQSEIDFYRTELLALLRSLDHELALLHEEASGGEKGGNLPEPPVHVADLGTHRFEKELSRELMADEQHLAAEVVDALNRIAEGKFGRCEGCGEEIAHDRLRAMPYARRCAVCGQDIRKDIGRRNKP